MIINCPDCGARYEVASSAFDEGGRAVRCSHCGGEWYQIGPSAEPVPPAGPAAPQVQPYEAAPVVADPLPRLDREAAIDAEFGREAELRQAERRQAERRHAEARAAERADAAARAGYAQGAHYGAGEAGPRSGADAEPLVADRDPRRPASPLHRRAGLGLRAAAFIALAFAVQAPIGLYYLAPHITEAAPGTSDALASYRSGVDLAYAWLGRRLWSAEATGGVVFIDQGFDLVEDRDGKALLVWGRVANAGDAEAGSPEIEIISRDADGKPLQTWRARVEAETLQPGESARFATRMMFPLGPISDVDLYFVKP